MTDNHDAIVRDLIDRIWPPIAARWTSNGFDTLTPHEQVFGRVWMLIAEVCNGGLAQYLFNSHGSHGVRTVDALRELGAPELAEDLRTAFAALPGGAPADTGEKRQAQLDALGDESILARFDKALYASHRKLDTLLHAFAEQHFSIKQG